MKHEGAFLEGLSVSSFAESLFNGNDIGHLTCPACGASFTKSDPASSIILRFPSVPKAVTLREFTLNELFQYYTEPEVVDEFICRGCEHVGMTKRQFYDAQNSQYLVVMLSRFEAREVTVFDGDPLDQQDPNSWMNDIPPDLLATLMAQTQTKFVKRLEKVVFPLKNLSLAACHDKATVQENTILWGELTLTVLNIIYTFST